MNIFYTRRPIIPDLDLLLLRLSPSLRERLLPPIFPPELPDRDPLPRLDPAIMAFGRFVPEREDDFAWENDKVAFRIYGPSSNGKGQVSGVDAWLKKVPYSIIDKWYAEHLSGTSYHEDQGEGYDPFHVGDSRHKAERVVHEAKAGTGAIGGDFACTGQDDKDFSEIRSGSLEFGD